MRELLTADHNPHAASVGDDINYREYKLLLRIDRFAKPTSFHKFWKITRRVANELGIPLRKRGKPMETHAREVVFFDTPKFRLYNAGFILRRRTFYRDGMPDDNHELTVKFRGRDLAAAASANVHPMPPAVGAIKFKEELLMGASPGSMLTIYSHGCELNTPSITLTQSFATIAKVFPVLERTGAKPTAALHIVNGVNIEELLVNLGELDFGDRFEAKATLAIWRNRMTRAELVGEYSYQVKFPSPSVFQGRSRHLADTFFLELQRAAHDWIHVGTTKTAMVYRLGDTPVTNHV
jgi:hypothetical protein